LLGWTGLDWTGLDWTGLGGAEVPSKLTRVSQSHGVALKGQGDMRTAELGRRLFG
jgi:hypothetical protein